MTTEAKIKVLLIDDDLALGSALSLAIKNAGYDVHYVSGLQGINATLKEQAPHLIVLDVEVGDKNSIDVIPQIRLALPTCAILMISSHDNIDFITKALEAGANHYLKKPFQVEELLAYFKKYTPGIRQNCITIGSSKLLLDEHKIILNNGQETHNLAKLEFGMLKLLISHCNTIVTREMIVKELYAGNPASEHSINNIISKLRKILSSDTTLEIVTVHKTGYKICNT